MQDPPDDLPEVDVLGVVRDQWLPTADRVDYLPEGFGAHHWVAHADGRARLFVTLDRFHGRHDAQTLEATYAATAELGVSLPFVIAGLLTRSGQHTEPLADGALSATRWVDGVRPGAAAGAVPLVRQLHATTPPAGIVRWSPLVPATFAADLDRLLEHPWAAGPHGPAAHAALDGRRSAVAGWTARYHRLAVAAQADCWVPTHGEPHERNQLVTDLGLVLVDWESLRLAPAERDLRWLDVPEARPAMVELFDLEWRLDEISQYAAWFAAPHGDGDDDRTALQGLRDALA